MKSAGMILIWLAYYFSGILLATSCTKQNEPMPANTLVTPTFPVNTARNYSYLALGDSYTIGQSVSEKERFPYLLTELLARQGLVVNNLRYIAQTGWSTIALQNAIANAEPLENFDIVTLLIGVNDQYQHLDTVGYRIRFTQLLNKAVSVAKNNPKHVFVLSIPDYSATPFVGAPDKERVRKEIDVFNAINKEITLQYNISYTDITTLSREAATNSSLLANDGLHYSGIGHMKWAEMLTPSIISAFK
jgi:lysophospholipase L1-like esterase